MCLRAHSVAAGGAGEVTELWIGGGRLHRSLRDSGSMVRAVRPWLEAGVLTVFSCCSARLCYHEELAGGD